MRRGGVGFAGPSRSASRSRRLVVAKSALLRRLFSRRRKSRRRVAPLLLLSAKGRRCISAARLQAPSPRSGLLWAFCGGGSPVSKGVQGRPSRPTKHDYCELRWRGLKPRLRGCKRNSSIKALVKTLSSTIPQSASRPAPFTQGSLLVAIPTCPVLHKGAFWCKREPPDAHLQGAPV